MIKRDDMLELTRRMTLSRSSIDRIAGAYFDEEGYVDGTFNTHFLKLSAPERGRHLQIAKDVIFAETNVLLRDYQIPEDAKKPGSIWQLLDGIKDCALKNDALLDVLYEMIGEAHHSGVPYAFLVFHGCYDVPRKGTDHEWIEGSEEVYEYLICALCPFSGDYEAGSPEFGFLYPAFRDRSSDEQYVNVFDSNTSAVSADDCPAKSESTHSYMPDNAHNSKKTHAELMQLLNLYSE
ncbi:MAG: DUF4317 domain-containing protein [Lachnospiraceae bacterium]|nr:DUF4317 domain-containing protein [Lachnospiraceae bacterium]